MDLAGYAVRSVIWDLAKLLKRPIAALAVRTPISSYRATYCAK